ncbi:RDD family protein [Nocardioides houyundeii]|uniref:RDD family protein n=1 Tax=Nocardioides houyundeii TaxID=2045452 RepID=UPI00131508B8|nr:RDD family protein [Nocardioides houyundeii]
MSAPAPMPPVSSPTYPVAELDRRFYAFALDRALAWGLYLLAAALGWWAWGRDGLLYTVLLVFGLAVLVTLSSGVLVGAQGATPGKSLVGLRVVHHGSGTTIGAGPGLVRALVLGVATLPTLGFGLAALAWTALADGRGHRRGWHDHRAGSVVVDVRPVVVVDEVEVEAPRHVVNLTAMRLVPAPPQPEVPRPLRPATPGSGTPVARAPEPAPAPTPTPARSAPPAPPAAPPVAPAAGTPPGTPPAPVSAPPLRFEGAGDPGRTVARRNPVGAAPGPSAVRWRVSFDTGESFVVEGLTLVGRRPEPAHGEGVRHVVALPSSDMSLSKTHAQFGPMPDGALAVMDRGSTNGSLLLRQGVTRELTAGKPTTLLAGDRVRFGDREMTVQREG